MQETALWYYIVFQLFLTHYVFSNNIHYITVSVDKPWKEISSQNSEPSQNVTKEPRIENTTNMVDNQTANGKGDTNATIYAGIVIGIIILIVIALMVYLSRKKVR